MPPKVTVFESICSQSVAGLYWEQEIAFTLEGTTKKAIKTAKKRIVLLRILKEQTEAISHSIAKGHELKSISCFVRYTTDHDWLAIR